MQLPVAELCFHPVPALEILLKLGCDQKLTGGAPTSLCSLSEADNTRIPLLVGFSFSFLEKKTGKEKKKSKKASLEGAPVADDSAEVHKKKKKKEVCVRPRAVVLIPVVCQAEEGTEPCPGLAGSTGQPAVHCGQSLDTLTCGWD